MAGEKLIAFIGGGNMAEALIKGLADKGGKNIVVSEPRADRRAHLEKSYGIETTADNKEAVVASDMVILAVKPQIMDAALNEIALHIGDKIIVSIAAGITIDFIKGRLKTDRIVRVMPNVCSMYQEGMAVLSMCECFNDNEITAVRDVFMASGRVMTLPEKYMNAVTALSGSGPAFIAFFIGAMIEASVKNGLSADNARELAVQTLIGTSKMLDTGLSTDALITMVKSPGGTTEAGLRVFEDRKAMDIINEAIKAAAQRASELAR